MHYSLVCYPQDGFFGIPVSFAEHNFWISAACISQWRNAVVNTPRHRHQAFWFYTAVALWQSICNMICEYHLHYKTMKGIEGKDTKSQTERSLAISFHWDLFTCKIWVNILLNIMNIASSSSRQSGSIFSNSTYERSQCTLHCGISNSPTNVIACVSVESKMLQSDASYFTYHLVFLFYIIYIVSLRNFTNFAVSDSVCVSFYGSVKYLLYVFNAFFIILPITIGLWRDFMMAFEQKKIVERFGAPENDTDIDQNSFSCLLHNKFTYLRSRNESSTHRFEW